MQPAPKPEFQLTSIGPDQWQTSECFDGNYSFFQGHFPGQPILPAVVSLGLSLELIRSIQSFSKWELKNSKFTRPIQPDERVEIKIQRRILDLGAEYKVYWAVMEGENPQACAEIVYFLPS